MAFWSASRSQTRTFQHVAYRGMGTTMTRITFKFVPLAMT